jgi:putative ABC transport system permease protein
MVLVISASLLLRSFWGLLSVRLGFDPQNVVSVRTRLPYPNDPAIDKYRTPAQEAVFVRELIRRSRTLPGVRAVAVGDTASVPLDESQRELNIIAEGQFFFSIEGRDYQADQPFFAEYSRVTPEYFQLLGIPLLHGRVFGDSDNDQAPNVAVVNEAFAQTYFPGQNAIGQAFRSTKPKSPWIRIVGVIANARTTSLAQANVPQIYRSVYQTGAKHLAIFLRGRMDTGAILEEVREQVEAVDPTLPVFGAQTLRETVSESLAERRFSMRMVGLFALTALLLAAIGIYGVISYVVSERTHEFGLRLALGADRRDILHLVVRQGIALALTGTVIGAAGALLVSQAMAGVLYGVKATDPMTFAAGAIFLLAVAIAGCLRPAWRATRVDPMLALRDA